MPLLWIKEDTTVGELKKFLAQIPDDAVIYTQQSGQKINIRFDHFKDGEKSELYIEEV